METDPTRRMQTLEARRSDLNKQTLIWLVILGIPMAIAGICGSYFESHPTFEESYLNQGSKRADISYGIAIFLMVVAVAVFVAISIKRNAVVKEIAEVDRIRSAAQQADLIGAAVKGYERSSPDKAPDVGDRLAQLERIGKLLADGTITQEEFERLKNDLMS